MWWMLAASLAHAQALATWQFSPGLQLVGGPGGVGIGLSIDALAAVRLEQEGDRSRWHDRPTLVGGTYWEGSLMYGKGGIYSTSSLGLQAGGGMASAPNATGMVPTAVLTGELGRTWDTLGPRFRAGARLHAFHVGALGVNVSPWADERLPQGTAGLRVPLNVDFTK